MRHRWSPASATTCSGSLGAARGDRRRTTRAGGSRPTPGEVLVTTGAQSAIHLLASVLLGRGDRVLIETPTYPHAADASAAPGRGWSGCRCTTDDGWDLDRAEQAFARTLPVVAYLMPDFQNPTGRSMTRHGARGVHATPAERAGSVLVLDETTADLDIDRGPVDRGFGDGDPAIVVRIGSLGKTVWGGLRVGWIRAESELIRRLVAARSAHDLGTPEFEQAVAASAARRDSREIAAQRSHLLRAGRDAAAAALARRLPEWSVPARARGSVAVDRTRRAAEPGPGDGRPLARTAAVGGPAILGRRRARSPSAHALHRVRRTSSSGRSTCSRRRGASVRAGAPVVARRAARIGRLTQRANRRQSIASSADQNSPRSRNVARRGVEAARPVAHALSLRRAPADGR